MKTWMVDTGPLVAYLDARDRHHRWAVDAFSRIAPPLHTCEAVLSEAFFLTRAAPRSARDALRAMVENQLLVPSFRLEEHVRRVAELMRKYDDVPMALGDACLVRMAELHGDSTIITTDSDFRVYRLNGRRVVPVLTPDRQR